MAAKCFVEHAPVVSEFDFLRYRNGLNDPKENKIKYCTVMKYAFYFICHILQPWYG